MGTNTGREVLPAESMETDTAWRSYKLIVDEPDHPTMKPLPWETAPLLHGLGIVSVKQGARELSKAGVPEEYPVMIWWDVGKGRSYGFTSCLGGGWGYDFIKWEYYLDYVNGFLYFTAGLDVPQDLTIVHAIRSNLLQYTVSKSMMFSLLDFIDKVGADTCKLEEEISLTDGIVSNAEIAYIEQDYERSLAITRKALDGLDKLDRKAMDLKDRTMFWTYLIEWSTVGGVSGLVGWLVYEIMIRRRLYREVGTTRFGGSLWKGR